MIHQRFRIRPGGDKNHRHGENQVYIESVDLGQNLTGQGCQRKQEAAITNQLAAFP